MSYLQIKKLSILVLTIFVFLFGIFTSKPVNAQPSFADIECGPDDVPYYDSSNFKAPRDDYDVYVKLGKKGQKTSVTFYAQTTDGKCKNIGSAAVNGERWTKVGLWRSAESNREIRLQLSSTLFNEMPSANRPSVMLISHSNPVCVPEAECSVQINGAEGSVIPTGNLLNEDTLHVVRVVNPETDDVDSVNYFVDSTFAYSTPTLEKFDMRYVPGGKHDLTRSVIFRSKQQVVIKDAVNQSYVSDFQNGIFRVFQGNRLSFQILLVILLLSLLLLLLIAVTRYMHRRKVWLTSHGIYKDPDIANRELNSQAEESALVYRYTNLGIYLLGGTVTALIIFIIFNTYLVQFFKVHGVSMETTVSTDDQMLINKLHKTWAGFTGKEYIPERGQVIVFHKAQSQFLQEKNEKDVFVVKRVIGLPGERVVIKKGVVTIYGPGSKKGFNPDKNSSWQKDLSLDAEEDIDITLSQSQVFVSGDNRPESIDSRSNGPISVNEIIGQAIFRVWPIQKVKNL